MFRCSTTSLSARARWPAYTALILLLAHVNAHAHKASDSYLQIDAAGEKMTLRWDIALRDLDAAVDIDTNEDGRLTWAEVKGAWPQIESYALARLTIPGCALRRSGQGLERRNDGAYAVLYLQSDCVLPDAPVIDYSLFREIDPTHRGIAKIRRAGSPLSIEILDPTVGASIKETKPGSDRSNASSSNALTGRWGFLREGIQHILTGYDHVLFLICLLLPAVMRRTESGWRPVDTLSNAIWPVIGIVSAFTLAHTITLGLAALKIVALPSAFIEPAIAVTIIFAALDNLWPVFPVRRVVVTFLFGLIHGFGFASVLSELNLPRSDFAWALLQFNVGLELGQLMIVVTATTALFLLRERAHYTSWVIRGGSIAAILIGTLWFLERTAGIGVL